MKSFSEELLDLIGGAPISIAAAAVCLASDYKHVRVAMHALNESGRADLVRFRGSPQLFLVAKGHRAINLINICARCHAEFIRLPKSKRRSCSAACHAALGWVDATSRAARIGAICRSKSTPGARELVLETNRKRWALPGEREKLSERNKQAWRDPAMRAKMGRGIRAAQQNPEQRELYSKIRLAHWSDPEKRAKMIAGIRASKGTPEARAKFSELLAARWRDPVMRAKYTKANRARNAARFGV